MNERQVAKSLRQVVGGVRPVALASEQLLPVLPAFEPILPQGIQRGQTLVIDGGPGASALALAMIAGATQGGSWAAAVGTPSLGVKAAAELGVAIERLLIVKTPAPQLWPTVAASLIDAFDLVLLDWPQASAGFARRLANRARERRAVLLSLSAHAWRDVADLRFTVAESSWQGLDWGHGRLASRLVTVEMGGRRSVRTQRLALWLPGSTGQVEAAAGLEPQAGVEELRSAG